tara:strand:+ start:433 stop:747 length:315 start_codon:yes stop_codon:yes gene_type:complete
MIGKDISIINDMYCHIILQDKKVNKKTITTGKINSAADNPNQTTPNALPLLFSKYLDIVVVEVCDINPWPENLIKKTPNTKKYKLLINEKKKVDNVKMVITIKE